MKTTAPLQRLVWTEGEGPLMTGALHVGQTGYGSQNKKTQEYHSCPTDIALSVVALSKPAASVMLNEKPILDN